MAKISKKHYGNNHSTSTNSHKEEYMDITGMEKYSYSNACSIEGVPTHALLS
jgi:hypothetical protein